MKVAASLAPKLVAMVMSIKQSEKGQIVHIQSITYHLVKIRSVVPEIISLQLERRKILTQAECIAQLAGMPSRLNEDISFWNFVPYSGLRKLGHSMSTFAGCSKQLAVSRCIVETFGDSGHRQMLSTVTNDNHLVITVNVSFAYSVMSNCNI